MDDRPRKDRLIQTRVPQDLESTLKDEARKRRLSVSHLIRNVLEDTFSLVDNVVTEVDRVVTDSVEMAQTLKRDAQRLAATARGHTAHRDRRPARGSSASPDDVHVEAMQVEDPSGEDGAATEKAESEATPAGPVLTSSAGQADPGASGFASTALADVYGFQELVLNRSASCANCGVTIARGARAHLGMTDQRDAPRVWVCQNCLDLIGG
jgi:hypothetical protein